MDVVVSSSELLADTAVSRSELENESMCKERRDAPIYLVLYVECLQICSV